MAEGVKRRGYDASGRRAQSLQTRQRIIDAAGEMFGEAGYRAASVSAIARRAGVNPDTVYALVGRKATLLRELVERAVSGTDRALAPDERDYVRAIAAEPDAVGKLTIYAAALTRIQARLAPLYTIIREAGPGEADVAALWREISERRFANMHRFVGELQQPGGLRADLTVSDAAAIVWTLNSPDVYLLLTEERGWPPQRVESWLVATWTRLLLAP